MWGSHMHTLSVLFQYTLFVDYVAALPLEWHIFLDVSDDHAN